MNAQIKAKLKEILDRVDDLRGPSDSPLDLALDDIHADLVGVIVNLD